MGTDEHDLVRLVTARNLSEDIFGPSWLVELTVQSDLETHGHVS